MAFKCAFVHEVLGKCRINERLKEVEFRNPYFEEKNADIYLCEMHFNIVFEYERNRDRKLLRDMLSAKAHYKKLKADTKKLVSTGIGNDNFDWETWNSNEWIKVEKAQRELNDFRRNFCSYEICNEDLRRNKNVFMIRIYPFDKMKYLTLAYCSEKHWEAIKRRIGLIQNKPTQKKYEVKTLDSFR